MILSKCLLDMLFGDFRHPNNQIFNHFQIQIWTPCLIYMIVRWVWVMIRIEIFITSFQDSELTSILLYWKERLLHDLQKEDLQCHYKNVFRISKEMKLSFSPSLLSRIPSHNLYLYPYILFINKSARTLWSSSSERSICLQPLPFLSLAHCTTPYHIRGCIWECSISWTQTVPWSFLFWC